MNGKLRASDNPVPGFVAALRDARVAAGLTQDALADRLGWGRTRLHEYETAARAIPARRLEAWAAALGYRIDATPTDPPTTSLERPK